MPHYLGMDYGGTFLKAGVYDDAGRERGITRRSVAVITRRPGWTEKDMPALWQAASEVIRDVLATSGVPAADVAAVGISSHGKGLYLLDREDRPLGLGILSSDQRAVERVRRWEREGLPAALYPLTLGGLWTGHPVSLLRWMKDEEPDTYRSIGTVLMGHDFLRFCMTGRKGCEVTNICQSNLYNMREGRYDERLAAMFGIPEVMGALPPVVGSTEAAGGVTSKAARETGLKEGTPVVGGLFDVVSSCLCAGIEDERRLNAVMGTWSITTGVTRRLETELGYHFLYGRYPEPGYYFVHEGSPTSAGNLEWFAEQFGKLDYPAMNSAVGALDKAGTDLFFVPFLYGTNAGLGMTAGFYGLSALHTRDHLLQAVYEGVVYCHLVHLDRMRRLFPEVVALRVTGGPARSAVWMQMLADASGLVVEVPQVEETGCLGAAIAASVGAGTFDSTWQAMRAFRLPVRTFEPDREAQPRYADKSRRYRNFVSALEAFEEAERREREKAG
jgi:L-xylulokinase